MRNESVSKGISGEQSLGNVTPPSHSADFNIEQPSSATVTFASRAQTIVESTAPTAEHESYDISFHPNESVTQTTVTATSREKANGKQKTI